MINDGLLELSEMMRKLERVAVRAGCPAAAAARIILPAEAQLINAINSACRAEQQFLLDLKEHGRDAMAERFGVTTRTITNWKQGGLNKKGKLRYA